MDILNLTRLLSLVEEVPDYKSLLKELHKYQAAVKANIINAARPFVIAALHRSLQRPVLLITANVENSRQLYEQLCIWNNPNQVRLLPEPDALPYERITPDSVTELDTLRTLSALCRPLNYEKPLVITSAHAFCMKQPPARIFADAFHTISEGMNLEPATLMTRWQSIGYQFENIVEVPGTMGRRGGIIDVYPPTSELPARIEFFGNIVESIRLFDPVKQRSVQKVDSVTIGPASKLMKPANSEESYTILNKLDFSQYSEENQQRFIRELTSVIRGQKVSGKDFYAPFFNQDNLISYLPENTVIILDEPLTVHGAIEDLDNKAQELRMSLERQGELPINFPTPYLTWDELKLTLENFKRLSLISWGTDEDDELTFKVGFKPIPSYAGQINNFINRVKQFLAEKCRIVIVSHQANRLRELLQEEDLFATPLMEIKAVPLQGSLTLIQGLLAEGWSLDDNTFLFTDNEIFGFTKAQRFEKKRPVARHKLFADIKPGDYVVHIEHGIGEFTGFTTLNTAGAAREYLVLRYAGGDILYVPTDQVDRISRYIGTSEHAPSLSRLGTQEWSRTRQRVKEATEEIARDLLNLYASREVVNGYKFSIDTLWQRELEASFPYIETSDQITVLQQVKEDMEQLKPMDRLVCGDVGYGKTEVALRAAFKAVMDSRQVAVLVPTTILAQQHYLTFYQRMQPFPIRVEVLSRFRSPREQKEVIEGLEKGSVDICIGTHRLIQKDVKFKDLGLLIIDEEQRFGVHHKEYLKKMRREVDVLTLSATPIPRTLHMSLVGVRDMSTMETPPEDRLPIKTYIAEYNERLIRGSILREMERNGQVFFVHNRVQTIELVANKLQQLVPEARISIAHGQMPEERLERITSEFLQGKADVLVCTTIIESGLDMPNVNTLIVNRADMFGLTQLYQLRGRVGRGATLAYAYFLFDKGKRITPVAEKRLRTIYEATELGAGFNIAMRDLEIRGAGTLLGVHQSGHISAVGFSLYSQMLASAVENLKAQKAGVPQNKLERKLPPTSVDLPVPALIPADYVDDIITRLELYQRLADITQTIQIEPFLQELNDRFGPPPLEVNNLLYMLKIKALASKVGIESINTEDDEIVLRLFEGMRFDHKKLAPLHRYNVNTTGSQLRIGRKQSGKGWQKLLEEILNRLAGSNQ